MKAPHLDEDKPETIYLFDCDGVLVDSNLIKTDAFRLVANRYVDAETTHRFVDYHLLHGGHSRWEKFQYLINISQVTLPSLDELSHEYSVLLDALLPASKPTSGIYDYLYRLPMANTFVVSGGEQTQVRSLLRELQFPFLNDHILGSPTSKDIHFSNIRSAFPTLPILAFGDSIYDAQCAKQIDADFLFVSDYSDTTLDSVRSSVSPDIQSINNFLALI